MDKDQDQTVEEQLGEMMPVTDDSDVEDTEDGGAMVKISDEPLPGESEFYANLVDTLSESELAIIGSELCDLVEKDKEARKRRDEQYEEGLRRTGLGDDAPGGAGFVGASKVVHPMLTEACVDFSSRVMKEIFPPTGPARQKVVGEMTQEKFNKSERLTNFLNWQMTKQMPDFRAELEQMSTQMPLGGVQYLKITWDSRRKRPNPQFVSVDDVYLPYAATNFYTAERKTHVQYITKLEYNRRVKSGMYRDIELTPEPLTPDTSKSEKANDKIEGRTSDAYNTDGLRTIFEISVFYDIEDDTDGPAPYVISVDKSSQRVLGIYRNWEEEDAMMEELCWMIEFPFLPWRGAYPIGLVQMIGGLSAATTGALRSLLDSAHINNFPGLLKLKGGSGGQTDRIDPTEVHEIEGSFGQDDIRKVMMPMPFNPPSPVLFSLLGFMIDAAKGVVRTTFEDLADSNQNVPVGTTLARLEQGMVVFSSIHARVHDAMARTLAVLFRINKFYMEEQEIYDETGELLAYRKDFEGPMNVVPVSDPNIYSETQRFAQVQAVVQRSDTHPGLYDARKVEELFLKQLKVPEGESLLMPKPEVNEMNAVNENVAATMSRPIAAFPDQDHLAHLQVHLDFMTSPILGASRISAPAAIPILLEHIREHITLWYVSRMVDVASEAAGADISKMMVKATKEEKAQFDKVMAAASQSVTKEVTESLQALPQIIEQAIQMLQSMVPQPQDPTTQVATQEIARKTALDQANMKLKAEELAYKKEDAAAGLQKQIQDLQAELEKVQLIQAHEDQRTLLNIQARSRMNAEDNQTAKQLAALEIQTGEKIGYSTGTGINPNPSAR
jgi:hypothetical protein